MSEGWEASICLKSWLCSAESLSGSEEERRAFSSKWELGSVECKELILLSKCCQSLSEWLEETSLIEEELLTLRDAVVKECGDPPGHWKCELVTGISHWEEPEPRSCAQLEIGDSDAVGLETSVSLQSSKNNCCYDHANVSEISKQQWTGNKQSQSWTKSHFLDCEAVVQARVAPEDDKSLNKLWTLISLSGRIAQRILDQRLNCATQGATCKLVRAAWQCTSQRNATGLALSACTSMKLTYNQSWYAWRHRHCTFWYNNHEDHKVLFYRTRTQVNSERYHHVDLTAMYIVQHAHPNWLII